MANVSLVDGHVDEVKDYPPYLDAPKKPVYRTNYDRIRNMSIEEMAECFANGKKPNLPSVACYVCKYDNGMLCTKKGECTPKDKAIIYKLWLESEVDTE